MGLEHNEKAKCQKEAGINIGKTIIRLIPTILSSKTTSYHK